MGNASVRGIYLFLAKMLAGATKQCIFRRGSVRNSGLLRP